jgi:two-component system sensor histidine kinase/response regulator
VSQGQKILIVDDREANLYALDLILRGTAAEVVKVASGNDALAATLDREFALAILDVQMPGMDGYELAELLKADPKTMHLPIIFLTAAMGDEQHVFKGYESGAVDYIVKPYNPAVLLGKVRVFLELDRQRQELHRQKVLLEAANKELEAFSYAVSHDLRAPLRHMDGFSKALLDGYSDRIDEQGRHYLQRVRAGARQMGELIDDLLKLSRVARSEMKCERVDLSAMASRIAEELRAADPGRDVEFTIHKDVAVEGDASLLRAAMQNLLGNAWKFTGKVSGKGHIEFGAARNADCGVPNAELGDGVRVCFVRDNGAGFDMAFATKLFGAFQRLHRADEFEGTGIGLATVQRIIHRHGGHVWAKGAPGKGATFCFALGATRGD